MSDKKSFWRWCAEVVGVITATAAVIPLFLALLGKFNGLSNLFLHDLLIWLFITTSGIIFLRCKMEKDMLAVAIAFPILFFTILGIMLSDDIACLFEALFGAKKIEVIKILGLGISGIIAVYGFSVLNRRAVAQGRANSIMEKRHVQDQRQAAVEHLGNERSSVRIASFHEFLDLANDKNDKDYTRNVLNILRAHLLNRGTVQYDNKELQHGEMQILVDVLFSEKAKSVFDKLDYDLQRVKFPPKIHFRKMRKPTGHVDFSNADLSESIFAQNDLSGFNFRSVTLHKTIFWLTNLQKADLFNATLSDAMLDGSNLSNADLSWANLRGANLLSVNFSGANLRGANLKEAKWLNSAILSEAEYNNNTTFPDEFDPEEHDMVKDE